MKTIYITAFLFSAILFASCARKDYAFSASGTPTDVRNMQEISERTKSGKFVDLENSRKERNYAEAGSMMIYDAELYLRLKKTDSAQANINTIAKKYGGYLLNSSPNLVTIRILSAQLHTACDEIAGLGKTEQNFRGRDVSEEFQDLSIRLDNADKTRKRYLELLDKANNVDDALKIERELERLNGTIDQLKGRLAQIEHLVAYSTVTVHIIEKKQLGPLSYVGLGIYKIVKVLFVWN